MTERNILSFRVGEEKSSTNQDGEQHRRTNDDVVSDHREQRQYLEREPGRIRCGGGYMVRRKKLGSD